MNWWVVAALAAAPAFAQTSGANGVYGGYVGSPAWFDAMRQSAANTAMLQSLQRSGGRAVVPPDYSEVSAVFRFSSGNPFPKGRLPNLRIACANQSADGVERSPVVAQPEEGAPNFYTVLKRGQSYRFVWMYYAGSKEQFAAFAVPADAPKQVRLVITVDRQGKGLVQAAEAPRASVAAPEVSESERRVGGPHEEPDDFDQYAPQLPPGGPDDFDLSAFPPQPTNFKEQQVMSSINSVRNQAREVSPTLKGLAHERLAKYYAEKGDTQRAAGEYAKARYWNSGGQSVAPGPSPYAPPMQGGYPAPAPAPYPAPSPNPYYPAPVQQGGYPAPPAPNPYPAPAPQGAYPAPAPGPYPAPAQQQGGYPSPAPNPYPVQQQGGYPAPPVPNPYAAPAAPQGAYPAPDANSYPAPVQQQGGYPAPNPYAAPGQSQYPPPTGLPNPMAGQSYPYSPAAAPPDPASIQLPAAMPPSAPPPQQVPPMAPKSTMQKLGDALKALSQMGDDSAPGVTSTATAAPNPSYQDPTKYALQGFPKPPAGTPQEQQIWGLIHAGPNMTSAQKAAAHQALAEYWQSKGQADKAGRELTRVQYWKAQP